MLRTIMNGIKRMCDIFFFFLNKKHVYLLNKTKIKIKITYLMLHEKYIIWDKTFVKLKN
jgi:hypothetical protein